MRVVSGTAGGLHLLTPQKTVIRPTQDRIKQVIFSSLAARIPDARVLDLYAGTGGLGIEALSRGATSADFVEQARECVECIEKNLRHCHLSGRVISEDAASFLSRPPAERYDLIFLDPPYDKVKASLDSHPHLQPLLSWIAPHGLVIWEHYSAQTFTNPPGWILQRQRSYGETGLTFLQITA